MNAPGTAAATARFNLDRPGDLDRPRWNHRFAHIIRRLRTMVAELAAEMRLPPGAQVLDYGCADMKYRGLFGADVAYLGADLPGNPQATVQILPDGRLPLADASCDAVLSTQVLEHVADPALYLRECWRVLKPGGHLLLSTHGIMLYHPDPVDLWRWTCEGLRRIVQQAGFEVARFEGILGLAATGLQLFQDATLIYLPGPLRSVYIFVMQNLITLFDRVGTSTRHYNALVFALLARKPAA